MNIVKRTTINDKKEKIVSNPCIPSVLPCNKCITLGICKSTISGVMEPLHNTRYGLTKWTPTDTRNYIYDFALIPLLRKCSDLYYYLQPDEENYPTYSPANGWRLINVYSVLSYLDMRLFCEYRDAIHIEYHYRQIMRKTSRAVTF